MTVERLCFSVAGDVVDDVVGHHFGLTFGEHPGHGERLAHLQRDPRHVPDGVHAGVPGVKGVSIGGNPSAVVGEARGRESPAAPGGVAHTPTGRSRGRSVGEGEAPLCGVDRDNLVFWVIADPGCFDH